MAISAESIDFRRENLEDIKTNSYPDLQQYSKLIEIKLRNFKEEKGLDCFIDLFRLSANISEPLKPDSSEEKVYSKYTDTLLCLMFNFIGIPSEEALQKPSLILRLENFHLLHRLNYCTNDCSGYF